MENRDARFDWLRSLGLLCIILAHTNPPSIIQQLRSFDVPLMVMVSGAVFGIKAKSNFKYREYIVKRLLRLLLPTWIFLFFLFVSIYFICDCSGNNYPFSLKTVVLSYCLVDGVGYLWIIKVFVLVALIAPFLVKMSGYWRTTSAFFACFTCVLVWFELLFVSDNLTDPLLHNFIFEQVIAYLIPYSCIFALGMMLPIFDRKTVIRISAGFFLVFCLFAFLLLYIRMGEFVGVMEFKYPPRLYYISFGVAMSIGLYVIFSHPYFLYTNNRIVLFSSCNSLWIYLWHIYFLYLWQLFSPMWAEQFMVKFLLITSLSFLVVMVQIYIVKLILNLVGWTGAKRYWVRVAFL